MGTIELKGCISNIRYISSCRPTYHFLLNGQFCTYSGNLPLEIGDYVQVTGRPNELSYTNTMGVKKTFKEIKVISISVW